MSEFSFHQAVYPGEAGASVPLTKGLCAFVSLQDLPKVVGRKWYAMKSKRTLYAASNEPMVNGVRGKTVLMHRLILGEEHRLVDHEDLNGLNNRRENLRPSNKSLNAVNSRKHGKHSEFRGVTWDSRRCKWAAYMRANGRSVNLGRFPTEREAADAYLAAATPHYGEFIRK